MGRGFQGAIMRAIGARDHVITVTGKNYRTDHYVRVTFRSDTLLSPDGEAPGNWIRAWFPDAGGRNKHYQRGYTLLDTNPATGEFAIDFLLHHPMGPASNWAANCEPGDQISAMRYGEEPFTLSDPPPAGYLLLGDLAGYPAISSIAASIPEQHEVVVYLERHGHDDELLPLPEGPNVTAAWIPELPDGQALVQAISNRDWTGWYAWVTGESTSTRHAKTLLQREHNLSRDTLHATAYWARGRAMGRVEASDEANSRTAAPGPDVGAGASTATAVPDAATGRAPVPPASGTPQPGRITIDEKAGVRPPRSPAPSTDTDTDTGTGTGTGSVTRSTDGILAPAKTALILAGVIQGLFSVLQVVPFILFARIAQMFLSGQSRQSFVSAGVWAVSIMAVTTLGVAVLMIALHFYDAHFSAALRRQLMDKVSRLPLGWFSGREPGELKKLVGDDVTALHYVIVHAVTDIVAAVVAPLTVLVYLFVVEWRLALVMLLPIVAYVFVMVRISRRDSDKAVEAQYRVGRSSSAMQTYIATNEVSRVYGDRSIVDIDSALGGQGDFITAWQRETGPAKIVAVMINRPTTVLGLLVLAGFVMLVPGWISAAELIPFLILGTSFGGQLLGISMAAHNMIQAFESKAGLELLLTTPGLPGPSGRTAPAGHVVFDHVRFGYSPDHDVLTDFSLRLEPGTVTAIVGQSGAGKSTVASLLARLWDVSSGSVAIDGKDIREMTADELYSHVTILLQDVQLIHASIRENIALTAPEADDEMIVSAARAAHIHEFVTGLPDGYDTVVSTDRLSGGERQRIGIARALLADTPIVVLDEATAAADPDSERAIQQGLDRLLEGKTVLMIAHRLHTVMTADRIVVMDGGAVTESGTHAELLDAGGTYAALWGAATYQEVR